MSSRCYNTVCRCWVPDVSSESCLSPVSVSAGDMMAAESMLSLRASTASLRKSQWSLKGERSEVTSCIYLQVCHIPGSNPRHSDPLWSPAIKSDSILFSLLRERIYPVRISQGSSRQLQARCRMERCCGSTQDTTH